MKKIFKKVVKFALWAAASIIAILLVVIIAIQIPFIQNKIKNIAIDFVEQKIGTPVDLERIEISFPKKIVVKGLYIESEQADTLLYTNYLGVDINLLKLLDNTLDVSHVELQGLSTTIKRDTLQQFNFDYIIKAFASEPKVDTTDSKAMDISIGDISFKQIQVNFLDAYQGNFLHLNMADFNAKVKSVDLEKQHYGVSKIAVDGLMVDYQKIVTPYNQAPLQSVELTQDPNTKEPLPSLDLGSIALTNFDITFKDQLSKINAQVVMDQLSTEIESIDLNTQQINIYNILWKGTNVKAEFLKDDLAVSDHKQTPTSSDTKNQTQEVTQSTDSLESELPWQVSVKNIALSNIGLALDDYNHKSTAKGVDPYHFDVKDLGLSINDFNFSGSSLTANIKDFAFYEAKTGFSLQDFNSYVLYDKQTAFVKDLFLQTPNSKVSSSVVLHFQDIDKLDKELGQMSMDVSFLDSYIGLKDIDLLMPELLKDYKVKNINDQKISFEILAKGKVNDLQVDKFFVRALQSTFINVSAKVKNLPEVDKAYVDLRIKDFQSSKSDITTFIDLKDFGLDYEIPALIKLAGFVKGNSKDLLADLDLSTTLGNVHLNAGLNQRIKDQQVFKADLTLKDLELGKIMRIDSLGSINMQASLQGEGKDISTAKASAELVVHSAYYNGYTYKDITLQGGIDQGKYELTWDNQDPNLLVDLSLKGEILPSQVSLELNGDFKNVDLYALNIDEQPRVLTTLIKADMANILPDSLVGTVQIVDLAFVLKDRAYALEPIVFTAQGDTGSRSLSLESQLVDFSLKGDYVLSDLPNALSSTFESYFNPSSIEAQQDKELSAQTTQKNSSFDYSLELKYDKVLKQMLPELSELENITVVGSYDQNTNYFALKAGIPNFVYAQNTIEGVYLDVAPYQDALGFSLGLQSVSNAFMRLKRLNLQGDVKDNMLRYSLNLKDSQDQLCYVLSGEVQSINKQIRSRIYPKGFMLDYQNWQVNPDNEMVISSEGIYIKDFDLSHENSTISIASAQQVANSPLRLDFSNFNLSTLTKTIKKDVLLAQGDITGFVSLEDLSKDFRFISDIAIDNFGVMEKVLGDLHIGVSNESLSKYLANVVLKGENNSIVLKGNADMQDSTVDMILDIEELQMSFLSSFASDMISNPQGYFSSKLNITGSIDDPEVLGDFKFNDVGIHVNSLNADFTKINETIVFSNDAINFNTFNITDSDGNHLVINGQVLTKDYSNVGFNLNINANDFKAISSTSKDNDMYYGTLIFDSAIKIRGDLNKPVISGEIGVGPKTDFTIVMPQEDPSIADREGIVEFIDQQSLQDQQFNLYQEDFNNSPFTGLDISMVITINKEAVFSMIMDSDSGDKVVISGQGDLVGGIDPSGNITLSGRYEFDQGSYDLSFNMIKRRFEVQKGSSIIFGGSPTDAILDLTAIYQVNTAPIDLLSNQLSAMSPSEQNMYKQKIPFQALLMMNGQLLKPEISFNIQLKEGISSVATEVITNTNTKLEQLRNNEGEMNKQVFALLLLNHFIGENPFESSSGGINAGSIARQSVNRILSDQLNNLASSLITGVDLNFNLESSEDFSTGTKQNRTDLNVAVSKRLFSDRLKVTVGSSFEVEGNQRANEQAANIAGDVELEYALSQDGRYLLRAYRKNRYEVALQGQVVETGVGFVITMSYDRFKELFENSKDKKELKKKLREQNKNE